MGEANGYDHMSPKGKLVCEAVELGARLNIEQSWKKIIPGYEPSAHLRTELNHRFAAMTQAEISVAIAMLTGTVESSKAYSHWLEQHLERHPNDSVDLFFVKQHFGGFRPDGSRTISRYVFENCGPFDLPWRMNHTRRDPALTRTQSDPKTPSK